MQTKHVGQYIKKRMAELNLTQKGIADKIGISPQSFCRYLKEESWQIDIFCEVSEAIGINPADYFLDEGTYNPASIQNQEVTNVTNLFEPAIGKVMNDSAHADDKTSLLRAIISHQAALIQEKERLIQEKERLISAFLAQKESKEDNI